MFTPKPGEPQAGIHATGALHTLASPAATALYDAINAADRPADLDQLVQHLWRGNIEGAISEADAEFLDSCIQRRRPPSRATAPRIAKVADRLAGRVSSRFTPRQRPRSPDRKTSRDRRRMLAGSSTLPPDLRCHYTEGQRAMLCIVAGEIKRQGFCDFPIDKIAALAGVCRTTVQTTMHEARRLGHIKITERPQRGRKSLPNLVEITSTVWRAWLRLGLKSHCPIGSNSLKMVSTTKYTDIQNEGFEHAERPQGANRGEPLGESPMRRNQNSAARQRQGPANRMGDSACQGI